MPWTRSDGSMLGARRRTRPALLRRIALATGVLFVLLAIVAGSGAVTATDTGGPVATCTIEKTTVGPGEPVTIDASDSVNGSDYQFARDRESGYGGYLESPTTTVVYELPGEYTPRVKVWMYPEETTDEADCPTVTVVANEPPVAAFHVEPGTPEPGTEVTLDASHSGDPDGDIVEYRWDLDGDGDTDEETTGPVTTHVYDDSGTRDVRLIVVDGDGATSSASEDVTVEAATATAKCRVEQRAVTVGEEVTVDASGSENAEGALFDLDGDGTVDESSRTAFQVTTTYDEAGEYTPRVRTIAENGRDIQVDCPTVSVEPRDGRPDATEAIGWWHSPLTPHVGEAVTLVAPRSHATVVTYRWDVDGDGDADRRGRTVTVTFDAAAVHEVSLEATVAGSTATETNEVHVVSARGASAGRNEAGTGSDAGDEAESGGETGDVGDRTTFWYAPIDPLPGETVTLVPSPAVAGSDGRVVGWDLNGNGSVDQRGALATTRFAERGPADVSLHVERADGTTETIEETLYVGGEQSREGGAEPSAPDDRLDELLDLLADEVDLEDRSVQFLLVVVLLALFLVRKLAK